MSLDRGGAPLKVVDPVCGMTIEAKDAFASSSYKGNIYYFCSEKCHGEFAEDTETVLAMKIERERSIENDRSKSLDKMMDQVAHEIRNPLTSIGGFARRMYERLPEGDPNRKYLEMVIEDVARLEGMIRQLVELKIVGQPRVEPSNMNDIIKEAVKSFDTELESLNVKVEIGLMDKPAVVLVDKRKMAAAIGNLIRNSIEALENAPGVLRISSYMSEGDIEIVVSDTGKGIAGDKIKYIFDPFFTSKIYGPGLGLTFARRIIEEHRGKIEVESTLGKGTTFTIKLPSAGGEEDFKGHDN